MLKQYIKDLGKTIRSLYKKTSKTEQKYFNSEDIKTIQKIETQIKTTQNGIRAYYWLRTTNTKVVKKYYDTLESKKLQK